MPQLVDAERLGEKHFGSGVDSERGAFVISLDFELLWGVREMAVNGRYRRNLLGARSAVPRILTLFSQFEVAATWATVGFLFARDRDQLADFLPAEQPRYKHTQFDPYRERIGRNEAEDPLHFGRSLLEIIRETPRQEIGSHTFSHYYCLEKGQNIASFRADLESAQRIAAATLGVNLRSLVLPRNQFNPGYATAIREAGFLCYRGNQRGGIYDAAETLRATSPVVRAARLADAYIPVSPDCLQSWHDVPSDSALCDVRASRFLRPYNPCSKVLDPLRASRIVSGMRAAARNGLVYHLWWHPHNFAAHIAESLEFLSGILAEFRVLRDQFGFRSMSMAEAAETAAVLKAPATVGSRQP
jgi:peptidoglycan/xylan/chitin deacetylase (PgdA/CDA1 family)